MTQAIDRLQQFDALESRIEDLQQDVDEGGVDFDDALRLGMTVTADILRAYGASVNKPMPVSDDLLELQKGLVKGDPSLTAVRDNVRELVYYKNCLDMGREDALPAQAEKMIYHTVRHIYLYLRSRCEQEGAFDDC